MAAHKPPPRRPRWCYLATYDPGVSAGIQTRYDSRLTRIGRRDAGIDDLLHLVALLIIVGGYQRTATVMEFQNSI